MGAKLNLLRTIKTLPRKVRITLRIKIAADARSEARLVEGQSFPTIIDKLHAFLVGDKHLRYRFDDFFRNF